MTLSTALKQNLPHVGLLGLAGNETVDHDVENNQYLCDLRLTDPQDDKARIERSKVTTLKGRVWGVNTAS